MNRKSLLQNMALLIGASVLSVLAVGFLYEATHALFVSKIHLRWRTGLHKNWVTPNTAFDPELGWTVRKGRSDPRNGLRISSNSLGFRSPEPDPERKMIAILGDSVAWGDGVSDDQTISFFLDRRLSPRGTQVQNLGVCGYGTDQALLFFRRHLKDLPNLLHVVLIVCTVNDLADVSTNSAYGKRKPLFVLDGARLVQTEPRIRKYGLRNLLSLVHLARRLENSHPAVTAWLGRAAGDRRLPDGEARSVLLACLEEMDRLSRERGARFTAVISPRPRDFESKTPELAWFEEAVPNRGLNAVLLMEEFRKRGLGWKSLFLVNEAGLDQSHYSPGGSERVAEILSAIIPPK